MRRALSALSFASLLAFAPACDSTEDESSSDFFRANLDVNIQMTMADGGDDDGSILWEIVDTEVFEGSASENNVLIYVENDAIYLAESGTQTCTIAAPYLNSNMVEVLAANGTDVLFTIWNGYVLEGEVNVKNVTFGQMRKKFESQLLFQYDDNEIYLGQSKDGVRLVSTDVDLKQQSEGRQLLIAALLTGECGTAGLPGYNF